ncbi:BrnA antitoxin family protein [Luteimonas sp. MHLX1A]|uniref:BrnA antitoxin family protein n=1 Tax=Alterluteimonas muca TaxID=2878684 RepID=UPI001E5DC6D5|nr:BrnA antitoxin family protein [Luteimonas sp. MHLX1A]MCD9047465.1 BrnA antitoxin family protein [Luteimonas sp. MHLX1A]
MIPDKLKTRLQKDRAMTTITLRIPVDVVESLKTIAPLKGMSGYQALLKAYVSEGLRRDEAAHVFGPAARLAEALRRRGVPAEVIEAAVQDAAA